MVKQSFIAACILAICLVIHITGMVFLGDQLVRRRQRIERQAGPVYTALLLMAVFATLIMLHVTEACLWAAFYVQHGLFQNYETSLYFSLKSYSTVGYGDVLLPEAWRLLGTIEAISGVLLCGLSTAFFFSLVNLLFQFRVRRLGEESDFSRGATRPEPTSREAVRLRADLSAERKPRAGNVGL